MRCAVPQPTPRPPRGKSRHRWVYKDPRWVVVRKLVLIRDDHTCRKCGGPGIEVHHVKPLEHGGAPFDPANLSTRCRDCHLREHDKRSREQREWDTFIRNRIRGTGKPIFLLALAVMILLLSSVRGLGVRCTLGDMGF